MTLPPKALVLFSGGLDSTTVLAMAKARGYRVFTLSFFYDQRHAIELEAAKKLAGIMGAERHLVTRIDLGPIGGSALTDTLPVPKSRDAAHLSTDIPSTYVPARNLIFLSYALAWAETLGVWDIFIGVNAVDYSGYPDCRPEFIQAFETMANLSTKVAVEGCGRFQIHAPLIRMSKAEIIQAGTSLGVDYGLTRSCYDPSPEGLACGACDSCVLRKKGFQEANISDPTAYQKTSLHPDGTAGN